MKKVLTWKFALIALIVVFALIQLYPPDKSLKPGLDLAGGTSLIYEIDTSGLAGQDLGELSDKMITVLKRRVDPDGVRNLIWRPLGNTRFEIQMPLASKEARQKRQAYKDALDAVLFGNINISKVMRSLTVPVSERQGNFAEFAGKSEQAKEILDNFAEAYDQLQSARAKAASLNEALRRPQKEIEQAGLDIELVQNTVGYWMAVDGNDRTGMIKSFLEDVEDDYSESSLALLEQYTNEYKQWSDVTDEVADPEDGRSVVYQRAQDRLRELILTEDELESVYDLPDKRRAGQIVLLKDKYPDRKEKIDNVLKAFNEYRQFRGRLDDPKDLQRMLKGAGILEFRILPTRGQEDSDTAILDTYLENLRTKGPKFASDSKYVWCLIEEPQEWTVKNQSGQWAVDQDGWLVSKQGDKEGRSVVVGGFGDKFYVLASNKKSVAMLHEQGQKLWKLKNARPTQDQNGRRAIGFSLDTLGAKFFGKLTGKNLGRPLCILLDEMAISAPYISSRITGNGIIQGSFTKDKVADMVDKLNAGSLPAMLIEQPISIKSIGPSIGADNRDQGIKAGIIGLVVVIVCMLGYYLVAGGVAGLALLFNLLVILAVMAGLRATFTLPGIAGLILTIGMSVDANVLIFERIREEQFKGSSLRIAIKNGYQKALRTIFDANITTFMTAAILYWRAPEEVRGFATVLMIGIVASMFTALFATRAVFDLLTEFGMLKEQLVMLQLIKSPKVDWMAFRPVFLTISLVLIAGGLFVFFTRDDSKNNKYDIEFTGGTAATINLKEPMHIQQVRERLRKAGEDIGNAAIAAANVYSIGEGGEGQVYSQFEINTTETNKTVIEISLPDGGVTVESIRAQIKKSQREVGKKLSNLIIAPVPEREGLYVVSTSQLNKSVVEQVLSSAFDNAEMSEPQLNTVVNNAILQAFGGLLEIRQDLELKIVSAEEITEEKIAQFPELTDYLGGINIACVTERSFSGKEIEKRFEDLRLKPEMENVDWYQYELLTDNLKPLPEQARSNSFIYVSVLAEAGLRKLTQQEWKQFADEERTKVSIAGQLAESLPRVTQVNPSIGSESMTRAIQAIVLSLIAIIIYIWVRFGDARFGFAAIAALVHDVCITLGAVTACTYIASTVFGQVLLIGDFKISQVIIAAFLTLIGYSLNDTIVVFDRIRENRRKAQLQPVTVNNSINQTISRTVITSFTTFIVVLIMYIFGGQNLRGFTFAIGFGIIIGTYSSIAIAAPLLLLGMKKSKQGSSGK